MGWEGLGGAGTGRGWGMIVVVDVVTHASTTFCFISSLIMFEARGGEGGGVRLLLLVW